MNPHTDQPDMGDNSEGNNPAGRGAGRVLAFIGVRGVRIHTSILPVAAVAFYWGTP